MCLVGERYGSNSYAASETAQESISRKNLLFELFLSRPRTFLAGSSAAKSAFLAKLCECRNTRRWLR
jgi:hypothetical protein